MSLILKSLNNDVLNAKKIKSKQNVNGMTIISLVVTIVVLLIIIRRKYYYDNR